MDDPLKHKKIHTVCLHLYQPPKQVKLINGVTYQKSG